jgi:hypothetical protein
MKERRPRVLAEVSLEDGSTVEVVGYVKKDRKDDFYRAIGYDTVADTTAADTVYQIIKSSQASKGKTGGARDLHEVAYGADAEFTYPVRKTLRHKNQWRKRAGTARRRAARK